MRNSNDEITPAEIQAELAAEHRAGLRRIDDFAFAMLFAEDGDITKAEYLADDFINIIFEDGVFCTWRYRLLLARIREGL